MSEEKKGEIEVLPPSRTAEQLRYQAVIFVQGLLSHGNATRAYCEAHKIQPSEKGTYPPWTRQAAHRLRRTKAVSDLLDAEMLAATQEAAITRAELAEWLTMVIVTPYSEIDWASPLCQGIKRERDGSITPIMADKMSAVRELIRIAGYAAPEELELKTSDDLIEAIRSLTGGRQKNDE